VQLFLLLKVGVELSDTFERQLLGEPDKHRVFQVLVSELFNLCRVGCREQRNLLVRGHDLDDLLNDVLEVC